MQTIQKLLPPEWFFQEANVTVTNGAGHSDRGTSPPPCHSQNAREGEGEGEGEGEAYVEGSLSRGFPHPPAEPVSQSQGSTRGRRQKPDPARSDEFSKFWKAITDRRPRTANRTTALRVWCAIEGLPSTDDMIAAWDAYITDLEKQNHGQHFKQRVQHPHNWLKGRVYESYLADITKQREQDGERKRSLATTIAHWNGHAQNVIKDFGEARFVAALGGSTLTLRPDSVRIIVPKAFQESLARGSPQLMRLLEREFKMPVEITFEKAEAKRHA